MIWFDSPYIYGESSKRKTYDLTLKIINDFVLILQIIFEEPDHNII